MDVPAYPRSANSRRAAARIASREVELPGRRPVRGVRVVDGLRGSVLDIPASSRRFNSVK
jgi:hypothetical protein